MIRSKFSLSFTQLGTCDMGELIPVGITEVLPGDGLQHSISLFLRCAPLVAPPMHPVDVRLHSFFVPHRLVWEDWEDFITGGSLGEDDSVFPTIALTAAGSGAVGTPADYYGMPTGIDFSVSALVHRGYGLIWNNYFRDQDLESEVVVSTAAGVDTTTNTALLNCDWEKDYLTSARPWEQKGPQITIPIGDEAPVVGLGTRGAVSWNVAAGQTMRQSDLSDVTVANSDGNRWAEVTSGAALGVRQQGSGSYPAIFADLSSASAITINALREALALQRFMEARARFGSRYPDYLRALGVMSSDARLQLPEYLGGGRNLISFSEVLQTAEGTAPVGEMKGHGITGVRSNRYRRPIFEEHGYIHSFLSVRPKTIYMNGSPRTFNRRTKEDFWQKELQFIGQQEVLNKEVNGGHVTPEGTFGFQDRYDEYRRAESRITGEFRTSSLNTWHFGRAPATNAALNASFVKCVPPDTPFAAPSEDVLYFQAKHSMQARRLVAATGKSMTF